MSHNSLFQAKYFVTFLAINLDVFRDIDDGPGSFEGRTLHLGGLLFIALKLAAIVGEFCKMCLVLLTNTFFVLSPQPSLLTGGTTETPLQ